MPHNARRGFRYGTLSLTATALTAAVVGLSPSANAVDDEEQSNHTQTSQSTDAGHHQPQSKAGDHAPGHRGPVDGQHNRPDPHRNAHSAKPERKHRDNPDTDRAPTHAAAPAAPETPTHTPTTAPQQDHLPAVEFTPPPPPQQDSPPVVFTPSTTVQAEVTLATGPQEIAGSSPVIAIPPSDHVIPIQSATSNEPPPPAVTKLFSNSFSVNWGSTGPGKLTNITDGFFLEDPTGRMYVYSKTTGQLTRVSKPPAELAKPAPSPTPVESPTLRSPLDGLIGPPHP